MQDSNQVAMSASCFVSVTCRTIKCQTKPEPVAGTANNVWWRAHLNRIERQHAWWMWITKRSRIGNCQKWRMDFVLSRLVGVGWMPIGKNIQLEIPVKVHQVCCYWLFWCWRRVGNFHDGSDYFAASIHNRAYWCLCQYYSCWRRFVFR